MADNFLYKNSFGSITESEIIWNQQLAEELHKQIVQKFKKRELYPSSKDNILTAIDL